jgi:hypothetical protein
MYRQPRSSRPSHDEETNRMANEGSRKGVKDLMATTETLTSWLPVLWEP